MRNEIESAITGKLWTECRCLPLHPTIWLRIAQVTVTVVFSTSVGIALAGSTEIVSVDSAGVQGNNFSFQPSVSADGRYVAFESSASNLVPGDTNGVADVFVHDRDTGVTERVSLDSAGGQGNSESIVPSISADGRYVAFHSGASNLVLGDTNAALDVFVHDRDMGITERVSLDSAGVQGNSHSLEPRISADGRYVAFESDASNLVPGDINGFRDLFVHDRDTDVTERVSLDGAGVQGNSPSFDASITADGRYVAFLSRASNLVTGDTNGTFDVFVRDRDTGKTERVSVDSVGVQGNSESSRPSIGADGRYVAFDSLASNLVPGDTNGTFDVFVHDRDTGVTERVSLDSAGVQGNSQSVRSSISADGRYVAFDSFAKNLVPGDTNGAHDVFVHDRDTGVTERVSLDSAGAQGNFNSFQPSISADGRYVAFASLASNLVPGDTNATSDVFVHDRGTSPAYSCSGFDSPMANYPVKAKKNRVFPLKLELFDEAGFELSDMDITARPVVQVMFTALNEAPTDVTQDALSAGAGTEGNQFEYSVDGYWQFNLKSSNYTAEGEYLVTAVSGDDSEYTIDPACVTSFAIQD